MRKSGIIIAALCATWLGGMAAGHAASVTVFHGAKTQTVDSANKTGAVTVLRPVAAVKPAKTRIFRAPRSLTVTGAYAAGNTLWGRNSRSGKLVACSVWSSGMVGIDTVRCTFARPFGSVNTNRYKRYNP